MDVANISFDALDEIAHEAGRQAAERALASGIPVTFSAQDLVIRVHPDGTREILDQDGTSHAAE